MSRLKIVELMVLAGLALLTAAKSVIKFIDCIFKMKQQDAATSAA